MNNNLIFSQSDKYELVATLGTGSFGTVYLVRHRMLECLRAIKVIPKTSVSTDSVLSEARLLKSLHHSGIPMIYEIEEDHDSYYLIEEYMEGETLEEFLLNQKHISHNTFYNFCLQICDIFCYLHNFRPEPILYLDIKPEHIIVCQMELKLIDFNVSVSLSKAGNLCHLYGNEGYSAPEIKTGASPNPRWDIYGIGKIFTYMQKFLDAPLPHNTHKILKKATAPDPACRYETVDELSAAIAEEQSFYHQELTCRTIAVVGSNYGCGTTHIAISLVSALNYMGYPACYYEAGQKNNLHTLKESLPGIKEKSGCFYYKYFHGYTKFGHGILQPENSREIRVYDYGSCHPKKQQEIYEADLLLFVCDSGIWNRKNVVERGRTLFSSLDNLNIICNMGKLEDLRFYAHKFRRPACSYPYDSTPFQVSKEKCRLFAHILQLKRRNRLCFYFKRLLHPVRP